nr:immunoglobulin light chain junction region [Macaca mulatta]
DYYCQVYDSGANVSF